MGSKYLIVCPKCGYDWFQNLDFESYQCPNCKIELSIELELIVREKHK